MHKNSLMNSFILISILFCTNLFSTGNNNSESFVNGVNVQGAFRYSLHPGFSEQQVVERVGDVIKDLGFESIRLGGTSSFGATFDDTYKGYGWSKYNHIPEVALIHPNDWGMNDPWNYNVMALKTAAYAGVSVWIDLHVYMTQEDIDLMYHLVDSLGVTIENITHDNEPYVPLRFDNAAVNYHTFGTDPRFAGHGYAWPAMAVLFTQGANRKMRQNAIIGYCNEYKPSGDPVEIHAYYPSEAVGFMSPTDWINYAIEQSAIKYDCAESDVMVGEWSGKNQETWNDDDLEDIIRQYLIVFKAKGTQSYYQILGSDNDKHGLWNFSTKTYNRGALIFKNLSNAKPLMLSMDNVKGEAGDNVAMPVIADFGFSDVAEIELHIGFDSNIAAFSGINSNYLATENVNTENGQVNIIWQSSEMPMNIPDGERVLELQFTISENETAGDTCHIEFIGNNRIIDSEENLFDLNLNNGSITVISDTGEWTKIGDEDESWILSEGAQRVDPTDFGLPAGDNNSTILLNGAGKSAEITFTGTKVRVYVITNPNGQTGDIIIDADTVANNLSWNSNPPMEHVIIFESGDLDEGSHTIKVVSGGKGIDVDYIEVIGSGSTGVAEHHSDNVIDRFRLYQNYPNPFNPETHINFDLKKTGAVALSVYDMQGRMVRRLIQGRLAAGRHESVWHGDDDNGRIVANGVYFYVLRVDGQLLSKKCVFMK